MKKRMSGDLGHSKRQVSMYLSYTLVSGVRRRYKDIAKNGASTSGKYDIFDTVLNVTCSQNLALYRH